MEFDRVLKLPELLARKSFFLFGPRATGKSTLIRRQLAGAATVIDLLDSRNYLRLSAAPHELEAMVAAHDHPIIVIDEAQRIPELLNEVHRLIESRKLKFLLTGSSARKLRRGQANLLAGRAWDARMFPLIRREIPDFDLDRYLRYGGLPAVWISEHPEEELDAYANTYLTEEIMAEGLIRKLPPFTRFLKTIALANAETLNFTKLANDCQVPPSTVTEYVGLLEDTLVGFLLPDIWLNDTRKRREGAVIRTLPVYLDFITMCVEAGLNFQGALSQAMEKAPPGPLRNEFAIVLRDMRSGLARADALRRMAERLDISEITSFVSAIIQAEKMGASLANVLRVQAEQRRSERFQRAEKMAMEAPVKLVAPLIIFIFPVTFIILGFPIIMKFLGEGLL